MFLLQNDFAKMDYIAFSLLALGMICLVDTQELTFDILGICFGILSALFMLAIL